MRKEVEINYAQVWESLSEEEQQICFFLQTPMAPDAVEAIFSDEYVYLESLQAKGFLIETSHWEELARLASQVDDEFMDRVHGPHDPKLSDKERKLLGAWNVVKQFRDNIPDNWKERNLRVEYDFSEWIYENISFEDYI